MLSSEKHSFLVEENDDDSWSSSAVVSSEGVELCGALGIVCGVLPTVEENRVIVIAHDGQEDDMTRELTKRGFLIDQLC